MTERILSEMTASISELKMNPMQVINSACGEVITILNRNKPAFYCVPPEIYEAMLDMLDDIELAEIVRSRENERGEKIKVNIDDL